MTIDEAFNASVAYYDEWMMKALPNYADIFSSALALPPFEPGAALDVLDLGAGTGLFSKHVLGKYPHANFVLVDLAEKMLGVARERFGNATDQFQYVLGDYRKLEGQSDYDLVISSLSIHHLADADKRTLFGRIYTALRKGLSTLIRSAAERLIYRICTGIIGWNRFGQPASRKRASRRASTGAQPMTRRRCWKNSWNG